MPTKEELENLRLRQIYGPYGAQIPPTNTFGQRLPLLPREDYVGQGVELLKGLAGLGGNERDYRLNQIGQILAAGIPLFRTNRYMASAAREMLPRAIESKSAELIPELGNYPSIGDYAIDELFEKTPRVINKTRGGNVTNTRIFPTDNPTAYIAELRRRIPNRNMIIPQNRTHLNSLIQDLSDYYASERFDPFLNIKGK